MLKCSSPFLFAFSLEESACSWLCGLRNCMRVDLFLELNPLILMKSLRATQSSFCSSGPIWLSGTMVKWSGLSNNNAHDSIGVTSLVSCHCHQYQHLCHWCWSLWERQDGVAQRWAKNLSKWNNLMGWYKWLTWYGNADPLLPSLMHMQFWMWAKMAPFHLQCSKNINKVWQWHILARRWRQ